jgi:transposase
MSPPIGEVAGMRGRQDPPVSMLAFVDLESGVPRDHPIRTIKRLTDAASAELSPLFDEVYAETGRPSISPERLLKASLLIALFSVRSERAFCEELEYHLLSRWFLDMSLVELGFDANTFSKDRERLLKHDVGQQFFDEVVGQAWERKLLSDEHCTVDGTLIEAAAGLKSLRRRDGSLSEEPPDDPGNPTVNFHGEQRSNKTRQSTTDPAARPLKEGKGKEAKLVFMGHALMENRHGLLVDFQVTEASGPARDGQRRDCERVSVQGAPLPARTIQRLLGLRHLLRAHGTHGVPPGTQLLPRLPCSTLDGTSRSRRGCAASTRKPWKRGLIFGGDNLSMANLPRYAEMAEAAGADSLWPAGLVGRRRPVAYAPRPRVTAPAASQTRTEAWRHG